MTIVSLGDETLRSGDIVAVYYSTAPFSLTDFINEVGGLDGVIMTQGISFLTENRRIKKEGEVQLYDLIIINAMMGDQSHLPREKRIRQIYKIVEEIDNGFKIREIPETLPLDVSPELHFI